MEPDIRPELMAIVKILKGIDLENLDEDHIRILEFSHFCTQSQRRWIDELTSTLNMAVDCFNDVAKFIEEVVARSKTEQIDWIKEADVWSGTLRQTALEFEASHPSRMHPPAVENFN